MVPSAWVGFRSLTPSPPAVRWDELDPGRPQRGANGCSRPCCDRLCVGEVEGLGSPAHRPAERAIDRGRRSPFYRSAIMRDAWG